MVAGVVFCTKPFSYTFPALKELSSGLVLSLA